MLDATSTQPQWLFGVVLSARKNSFVRVVGRYLRNGSDNLTFLKSVRNSIQYFREVIASAPAAPNKSFIAQCLILVLPPYSLLFTTSRVTTERQEFLEEGIADFH